MPPRHAPLSAVQEREAVVLLAELLLDAAVKRPDGALGSAFDGVADGAIGGVIPFPEVRRKAREAA